MIRVLASSTPTVISSTCSPLRSSRRCGTNSLRLPVWTLHRLLAQKAPTIGNLVGLAAATAEVHGPETGLNELAQLPEAVTGDYQPFWALKYILKKPLNEPGGRSGWVLS